jgi:RNA recognition motif-containing protein
MLLPLFAVVEDENGVSRGYGFVKFSDMEERDRCVAEIDGMMFGLKPISVRAGSVSQQSMLTETYQNQQVAAVYAYGGYMYGQPAAGYYDYSQMANYNQYAAVNTSSYNTPVSGAGLVSSGESQQVSTATTSQVEGDTLARQTDTADRQSSTESANAELFAVEKRFFAKMQAAKWDFMVWGKELMSTT